MIDWNLDPIALSAWADRLMLTGLVLYPEDSSTSIGEILLYGYVNNDCTELSFEGPLRIEATTQEAFFAVAYAPRDCGEVIDTYYDVEPVGWTSQGRSMWIFGPTYGPKLS